MADTGLRCPECGALATWSGADTACRQCGSVGGDLDAVFLEARDDLVRLACRTVGSRSEAEDVVQEVWLRWHRHRAGVVSPRSWLRAVTKHAALDRVRASASRLEVLREPDEQMTGGVQPALAGVEAVEDVAGGIRVVLATLSPLERAVFVLREGLEWSYPELARLLERSEPALRQLHHRAKARIASRRERFEVSPRTLALVSAALVAVREGGDVDTLLDALAPGVQRVGAGYQRLDGRMLHLVAGLLVSREDRLLLCHRRPELPWYPGVWDVAGGHLRPGEPAAACAVRAARDELRISVTAPEPVQEFSGDDFRLTLFRAPTWEGEPRNLDPAQHADVAFVTREQASRLPLANRGILDMFDRFAA